MDIVASAPCVRTRVLNTPLVVRRICRAKIIWTSAGRPIARLSRITESKEARARRGRSSTRVREVSTWRMDSSHQYPAARSFADKGVGQRVADPLEAGGIGAGAEAVGEGGVGDPPALQLALGPLVAVQPHLRRVREVRAHLDERGPEVPVPDVEVEAGHPTLGLAEAEVLGPTGLGPLRRCEHPLELLGHPDGHDPGTDDAVEVDRKSVV